MNIEELLQMGPKSTDRRDLRVTVPARLHVKLHSLKVLEGVEISAAVEAAVLKFLAESGTDVSA